jgi:hypothetical protein
MRRIGGGFKYLFMSLLLVGWAAAYFALPFRSPYDGPFDAQPFGFEVSGLPFISKTDLKVLGFTVFVLESRENLGADPGTVFVLRNSSGRIRWTRLGAPELGRIRLEEKSAHWFIPGGWVIRLKPEYTGEGQMYVSPLGGFRFFFHKW